MTQWTCVGLVVFSALVALSSAGSFPKVKNLKDKKCIECYGHIAEAYMQCIQATIKYAADTDKASEECDKAQKDAMTFCPDRCMRKPTPPGPPEPPFPAPSKYSKYDLGYEAPSEYEQLKAVQAALAKPDEEPEKHKCVTCYGRIATAFVECLQGTYDHPGQPAMVEQLCNEAVEQATKQCEEGCVKKSGECLTSTLNTEDFILKAKDEKVFLGKDVLPPATMKVLKNSDKFGNSTNAGCIPCYGRIASAFIECLQETFSHPNDPELVEKMCDMMTSKAMEYCADGCFDRNNPPFPYPPRYPFPYPEPYPEPYPDPFPPMEKHNVQENEIKVAAESNVEVGPKKCPMGQKICVAEGSGSTVCCPNENACCGQLKWDVGAICCPAGWCCNKKESYYVPQCVPPLMC